MPRITIAAGTLLILLGVVVYFATGMRSATALIPAAFGVPLVLAGLAARKDAWRMHAMHAAAMIALLGLAGALVRPARKLLGGETLEFGAALGSQAAMALVCAVFVGLAVKSFVDARIRRRQAERPRQ